MGEHDFLYSNDSMSLLTKALKSYGIKHVYYVGLPPKSIFRINSQMRWKGVCDSLGVKYTLVEIFKPWCDELIDEGFDAICEDILELDPPIKGSLLLWSHGPEHVEKERFIQALPDLKTRYANMFIAMPYGIWNQGSKINPYEHHLWSAVPSDLKELNFSIVRTNGPKDRFGDMYALYYNVL